jgi:hypothetical protein
LHLGLLLAVLLGKPRGRKRGILHLVLYGGLLPPSYDAFLASLIVLTKSMLTLMADGFKLGLQPLRGPQQLITLVLHLLGLLLVLMGMLNEGQQLLPCLLSVSDRLSISDAEIRHFAVEVGHLLLGLCKPCLSHGGPLCLLQPVSPRALLMMEKL